MKELIIKIPKGYMNVGISTSNKLIADTNDSSNWDEIYFPLPKGKWLSLIHISEPTRPY